VIPVKAISTGIKTVQYLRSLPGPTTLAKKTIAKVAAKAEKKRIEKTEIADVNQSQILGNSDINYLKTSGSTMQPDTGKSIGLLIVAGVIAWLIFK